MREEVAIALDSGVVAQVLEGWSSQFAAWRKSDDHVVRRLAQKCFLLRMICERSHAPAYRQLKGHISELEDANRSLISFLNEYITTSEFVSVLHVADVGCLGRYVACAPCELTI